MILGKVHRIGYLGYWRGYIGYLGGAQDISGVRYLGVTQDIAGVGAVGAIVSSSWIPTHTHTQPSQRGEDSEVPLNVVAPSWLKWIEMAGGWTRWELGRVGSGRAGKPGWAGWLSGMVGRVGAGQDQVKGLEV